MYKVIHEFLDLKDSSYHYHVGDEYPRHGVAPTKERIVFLLSNQNLLHTPVIEEVMDFNAVEQGTEEEAAQSAIEGVKRAVKAVSDGDAKELSPSAQDALKRQKTRLKSIKMDKAKEGIKHDYTDKSLQGSE